MTKNEYTKCPFCGCEAWIIHNTQFQCFLCKAIFFGKTNLSGKVKRINSNLRVLRKVGMYKFPDEKDNKDKK